MTYPVEFRKIVLTKLDAGMSIRHAAELYDLSPTTIQRWRKRLQPKPNHERRPRKIDNNALRADVKKYPHDYQCQRAKRFNCSDRAIGKALKRLNLQTRLS